MAITEIIFGTPIYATVGIVQFDASVNEVHSDEAEITDHPIEEGSIVSDHIRKKPASIEINGLVTNTPITFLASVFGKSPLVNNIVPSLGTRVNDAYEELLRVMEAGETVDVITSLRDYENMAITSMTVNRNAQTGNVLDCTISLREIIIANSLTMDIPLPVAVANQIKANRGKKPPSASSSGQTDTAQSMLLALFG